MGRSLSEMFPELAEEWSDRNLSLRPDQITYGSNKRVWWHGKCGHEWETSVKARTSGERCPYCSGKRVLIGFNDLETIAPRLALEWSEKNTSLTPKMVTAGSHKKVWWHGKCGHEWQAVVKNRAGGAGCPYCSSNRILPGFNDLATVYPGIAAEWSDKNLPLKPSEVAPFANRKAWWKCRVCGNEWETLISIRSGGSTCPYCSGIRFLPGFNDLATTYPKLAEEWSERNDGLMPDAVNSLSRRNVWWRCRECGHEWQSVVYTRANGGRCPVCEGREVKPGFNDLKTTDPKLCREWDPVLNGDLTPDMVEHAEHMAAVLGLDASFLVMDAENPQFEPESFDVLVTRNLTWTLPHIAKAYREWYQLLKPGGVLINFDADYCAAMEEEDEIELPENHAHKLVPEDLTRENEAITMELSAYQGPRPQWDVQLLVEAGFERICVDMGVYRRIYAEIDEFYNPTPIFTIAAYK